MSGPLIILTGIIYAYVSGEQWGRGNLPMAWTYFGYALANIGLWMAVK
jgi:hypothetical protein